MTTQFMKVVEKWQEKSSREIWEIFYPHFQITLSISRHEGVYFGIHADF